MKTKQPAVLGRAANQTVTHQTITCDATAQWNFAPTLKAIQQHEVWGMTTIPVQFQNKRPLQSSWEKTNDSHAAFRAVHADREPCNIGLVLGTASGVVDVDLDHETARKLAPKFLPKTGYVWGRKGNPSSHHLFRCAAATMKTEQFKHPDGKMLVEIRGDGAQSVIPPSIHKSGEPIEYVSQEEPDQVDYDDLKHRVTRLAAATVLAMSYPGQGSRNSFVLALSGTLAHAGWNVEDAVEFIGHVVDAGNDDEYDSRLNTVRATFEKHARGEEVTGRPTLATMIGERVVNQLAKWLGWGREHARPTMTEAEAVALTTGLVKQATTTPTTFLSDQLGDPKNIATLIEFQTRHPAMFTGLLSKLCTAGLKKAEVKDLKRALKAQGKAAGLRLPDERGRYFFEAGETFMAIGDDDGARRLANFEAQITGEIIYDDGTEKQRHFELTVRLHGGTTTFTLPAGEFAEMKWVAEHCGAQAIVEPGRSMLEHLKVAIQTVSGDVPAQHKYTCTGWVRDPETGRPCYAHADGAIGPDGPTTAISTRLDGALGRYRLPTPPTGDELRRCFDAFRRLHDVAPPHIIIPLTAAVWRSLLSPADFGVFLVGKTGTGKSELSALATQFFGPDLSARNLPGSFTSTGNALEMQAFFTQHALFTIDDFAPASNRYEAQRLHETAGRIVRSAGNHACRARLTAGATLREAKPPRCTTLMSGESVPRGHSILARLLVLEIRPDDVQWDGPLTECQGYARDGLFAGLTAAYVQWLAGRLDEAQQEFDGYVREEIAGAHDKKLHRRTNSIAAQLIAAYRVFLHFAVDRELMTAVAADQFLSDVRDALATAVTAHSEHQTDADEVERFLSLLRSALGQGRCYLTEFGGGAPSNPQLCGYYIDGKEPRSRGDCIGVIDGNDLYLLPEAACSVANKVAHDRDEVFALTAQTMGKRLNERNLLQSRDNGRDKLTVRKSRGNDRRNYWHLPAAALELDCPNLFDDTCEGSESSEDLAA